MVLYDQASAHSGRLFQSISTTIVLFQKHRTTCSKPINTSSHFEQTYAEQSHSSNSIKSEVDAQIYPLHSMQHSPKLLCAVYNENSVTRQGV